MKDRKSKRLTIDLGSFYKIEKTNLKTAKNQWYQYRQSLRVLLESPVKDHQLSRAKLLLIDFMKRRLSSTNQSLRLPKNSQRLTGIYCKDLSGNSKMRLKYFRLQRMAWTSCSTIIFLQSSAYLKKTSKEPIAKKLCSVDNYGKC